MYDFAMSGLSDSGIYSQNASKICSVQERAYFVFRHAKHGNRQYSVKKENIGSLRSDCGGVKIKFKIAVFFYNVLRFF